LRPLPPASPVNAFAPIRAVALADRKLSTLSFFHGDSAVPRAAVFSKDQVRLEQPTVIPVRRPPLLSFLTLFSFVCLCGPKPKAIHDGCSTPSLPSIPRLATTPYNPAKRGLSSYLVSPQSARSRCLPSLYGERGRSQLCITFTLRTFLPQIPSI